MDLTSLLVQVLGPMPAVANTPFLALAVLSGLGLLAQTSALQQSTTGVAVAIRENAMIRDAARHTSMGLFVLLLVLAFIGYAANSGKLQGIIGKLFRVGEDMAGAIVYTLLALSVAAASPTLKGAGVISLAALAPPSVWFFGFAVLLGLSAMLTVRFALDLMIWLVPFPFIDWIFETCKKFATLGFFALYLFAPKVAVVLSIIVLVLSAFGVRAALRLVSFAFAIPLRPLIAAVLPKRRSGIVDAAQAGLAGEGPEACEVLTPAAALELAGVRKRQVGALVLRDGVLTFRCRAGIRRRVHQTPIDDGEARLQLVRVMGWIELRATDERGRVLLRVALPRTILPEFDRLRALLHADDAGHAGLARMFAYPPPVNRPRAPA